MSIRTVFGSMPILTGATEPTMGDVFLVDQGERVYQVVVEGASAIVDIEGSLDGVHFVQVAQFTLADEGSGHASDGLFSAARWRYVRASVVEAAGAVSVYVGV